MMTDSFFVIAGPCVIEDELSTLRTAERLREIALSLDIPLIFKASYDKANRTSVESYRGLGIGKGLEILYKVKTEFDLRILSDVHCIQEVDEAAEVLDVIQVPAFLSRQTDLITKIAETGKIVNIKKGQFMSPWDIGNVIKKVEMAGNQDIIITERGTSFGYNNLVVDMRSIPVMKDIGYPVILDATHAVQLPGKGGQRQFIAPLAKAAVAAGADGIFLEVHEDPDKALCDGPNSLPLSEVKDLLRELKDINQVVSI